MIFLVRDCGKARKPSGTGARRSEDYVDIPVDESVDNSVPSGAQKMSTFGTIDASHESGSLPGHLSMPETHDSFLIPPPADPILVPGAARFVAGSAPFGLRANWPGSKLS